METISKSIDFSTTKIVSGFWADKQQLISDTTIHAVCDRFKETGRIDAFAFDWKEGMPNRPHIFWDSDVAKWIESVACLLQLGKNPELETIVDHLVEQIIKNQDANGYFNIYFTVIEPEARFTRRSQHELYCAGHLMEAAVAYHNATGKDAFLCAMCRYADYIERRFVIEKNTGFLTGGHPEIELALVKLYHATDEERYLALSEHFVSLRGREEHNGAYCDGNAYYAQDHAPAEEQTTAEGHAVRAVYFYSAMADIAGERKNEKLFTACKSIFEDIATKKMYVTGGIGSSACGECFTIPYDLPNLTAYSESCAAIGLCFFAQRMAALEADSLYGDAAERAMYNGCLSSLSLDGKSFFYENPLELYPPLIDRDRSITVKNHLPCTRRSAVFDCSCCPPNITRFFASIGNMLYSVKEKTLFVHHYMESTTETDQNGNKFNMRQTTGYPYDGKIQFSFEGEGIEELAFRIPGWCEHYALTADGKQTNAVLNKGYAYIPCTSNTEVVLDLRMDFLFFEAHPAVKEDCGKVALQRGPVVFCMEEADNGKLLQDVCIDTNAGYKLSKHPVLGIPCIQTTGWRRNAEAFRGLYRRQTKDLKSCKLTFIPYYAFANREEGEMTVWVHKK